MPHFTLFPLPATALFWHNPLMFLMLQWLASRADQLLHCPDSLQEKNRSLWSALRARDTGRMEKLLSWGASCRAPENAFSRQTLIHCAAEAGFSDGLAILLDHGAPIEDGDDFGNSPLHLASRQGQTSCASLLARRGAALEIPNVHGARPLWLAARANDEACVALLLSFGADPSERGDGGLLPEEIAPPESLSREMLVCARAQRAKLDRELEALSIEQALPGAGAQNPPAPRI